MNWSTRQRHENLWGLEQNMTDFPAWKLSGYICPPPSWQRLPTKIDLILVQQGFVLLLDGRKFKAEDTCQVVCICRVGNWNLWSQFFVGMIRFLLGPSWRVDMENMFLPFLSCLFYVSGLDHIRAGQKLKQIVRGIVQMSFKHWQEWGINHVSRKTVPGFGHPLCV